MKRLIMILAVVLFPDLVFAESSKRIGSWEVSEKEPDPGRLVVKLTAEVGQFALELYCLGGPWRLFLSEFSDNDTADHTSPVTLTYSIDGGLPQTMIGEGHKRYRFELHHDANVFVGEIVNARKDISFAIEPRTRMTTMPLLLTREAITPFLNRCPLT